MKKVKAWLNGEIEVGDRVQFINANLYIDTKQAINEYGTVLIINTNLYGIEFDNPVGLHQLEDEGTLLRPCRERCGLWCSKRNLKLIDSRSTITNPGTAIFYSD